MGLWDWIEEFERRAWETDDAERKELVDALYRASAVSRNEPALQLSYYNAGRELAKKLGESWWVLFFDHWRLQTMMHYLHDYKASLDLAVQATTEVRKPQYANLPQRICLHEDLISAFVGVDPEGRQDQIRSALDFMQAQVTDDVECRLCLQNLRFDFLIALDRYAEAEAEVRRLLDFIETTASESSRNHHMLGAYGALAELAFRQHQWDKVMESAKAGEELARKMSDRDGTIAEMVALQAAAAAHLNDTPREASRLARMAVGRAQKLNRPVPSLYVDALIECNRAQGKLDDALRLIDAECPLAAQSGRSIRHVRLQIVRCRLRKQLGLLTAADLAAARESTAELKHPQKYLDELAALEASP